MKTRLLTIGIIVCLAIVMPAMLGNHIQILYQEKSIREGNYTIASELDEQGGAYSVSPFTEEQIDDQIDIVFGNALKSWTVFPGGAGYVPPQNSTLVRIYKEVNFGITPLNFTAMLNDKIFVNKCESNDGVWNYTYHDCEILESECVDLGGIMISRGISVPCTGEICLDRKVYRMSCVFEYEI